MTNTNSSSNRMADAPMVEVDKNIAAEALREVSREADEYESDPRALAREHGPRRAM